MEEDDHQYIHLEPVYPNSFDPNQYRERNNASWDRIRHENAASVRSEPPNYMFFDIDAEPLPSSSHSHLLSHKQSKNIGEIESEVGQFESEEGSVIDSETIERSYPVVQHSRETVESEKQKVEELPDIFCMECDALIDANTSEQHTLEVCAKNKPKKMFRCSECPEEFNFDRNCKVHKIVKHMTMNEFTSGQPCIFCPESKKKSFLRFSAFIGHVQQHFQSDFFICKFCAVEIDNQVSLKKHIRHEHGVPNELLYCPKCEDVLAMEEKIPHLLLHITHKNIKEKKRKVKTSKKEKKHKCSICDKMFARLIDLKRHDEVHKREQFEMPKWKCAICDKEYSHQSGLYEHKRTAHGNSKKIECLICGLNFAKKSNLSRHVKNIHPLTIDEKVGKDRFECEDCPSILTSQGALTLHKKRVHNTHYAIVKKPILAFDKHKCGICSREFKEVKMLERHKRMHLLVDKRVRSIVQEKKCEYCERRFIFPASLVWHRQTHFDEEKNKNKDGISMCSVCNINFPNQELFKEHWETNHSISCSNCQQKFLSKQLYDSHNCNVYLAKRPQLTTNPSTSNIYQQSNRVVVCRLCKPPQRLVTLRQINEHRAKHQPRKVHLCWTCHKSFRTAQLLSLHRMVHNSQPLPCPQCRIVFRSRVVLKQHIRSVHSNENNYQCVVHTDRNAAMSVQSFAEYGMQNEASGEAARAHSVDDWMEQQQYEEPVEEQPIQFRDGQVRCEVCQHLYENTERLCDHWHENESERDHSFSIVSCPVCRMQIRGTSEAASHLRFEHLHSRPRHVSFVQTIDNYQSGPATKHPTTISQSKTVHQCTVCQRMFKKKCDLTRHIRIHTGERPFQCPICNMAFSVKSTLKSHMNIHSNNPATHECGVCHKRFFDRKALLVHIRIHTGETPIKCKYCNDCFRTSSLAQKHEKQCFVKNGKYFNPHLPSTSNIVTNSYPRDVEISQTIRQISTLPQKQLTLSHTSAFNAVQPLVHVNNLGSTYIITKPVTSIDFVVVVQPNAPPKSEIREAVDTVSCVDFDQLRGSEISIVLHNNMRLIANIGKLMELVRQNEGVMKVKVRVGDTFEPDVLFMIIEYEEVFNKRCDICEMDFTTKDQSDEHFYSEDHETAQLMFPTRHMPDNQMIDQSPAANNGYPTANHDNMFNCKLCGKRFLDLEPLIAHINKEHDRDADTVIPPRPAAHTAPIH